MKCTVIGSCGGACRKNEACSGYLIEENGYFLLLDCGNGVASLIENIVPLTKINDVILTHWHYDHISDYGGLIYSRLISTRIGSTNDVLNFYALNQVPDFQRLTMNPYSLGHEINENSVLKLGPFTCSFLKTKHPVSCLAVKIESSKKTLVYTSDGGLTDELIDFSKNTEILISECSLYEEFDGTLRGHMNACDVATLATKANPKKLILSHLPIYGDLEKLKESVVKNYNGDVELATKFKTILL